MILLLFKPAFQEDAESPRRSRKLTSTPIGIYDDLGDIILNGWKVKVDVLQRNHITKRGKRVRMQGKGKVEDQQQLEEAMTTAKTQRMGLVMDKLQGNSRVVTIKQLAQERTAR